MKFSISFKTPDALDPVIQEHQDTHCIDHDEYDANCDACCEREEQDCQAISQILKCAEKFISCGEYITIEFDTETKTATVVPL